MDGFGRHSNMLASHGIGMGLDPGCHINTLGWMWLEVIILCFDAIYMVLEVIVT